MKKLLILVASLLASQLACAAPTLDQILKLSSEVPAAEASKIAGIRESGMRLGAQGGLIHRAKEIAAKIRDRAADLDRVFAFQPLLDEDGLLPPVISESDQKVETRDGAQRLEFAGKTYKIVSPARFVRVVPTWRDYLFDGLADERLSVDELPQALRPSSQAEKSVWEEAVKAGWSMGVIQADAIFAENTSRLRRDYLGMLRYHSLVKRGMVKRPILAKTPESIKVTDDEIAIGVGVKEVQIRAVMESDQGAWGAD